MVSVSTNDVRVLSGANSDLISDADITTLINGAKDYTRTLFQIEYEPKKKIETLTGEWKDRILVDEYFPLTVLELRNGETTMDKDNLLVHSYDGMIEILGDNIIDAQFASRFSGFDSDVRIKYLYGAIEKDNETQTEAATALTSGTAVSIEVDDSTGFLVDDWIFIEDLNQRYEVAQITVVADGTHITVGTLTYDYEIDALITQSKCNPLIEQFIKYEAAIAVATNATGSTFEFAASYQLPEFSVVKGVPFTHWRESFSQLIKQRNNIRDRIKGMLASVV